MRIRAGHHDGAGVDGDACGELDPVRGGDVSRVAAERVVNREGGANGAFGVVTVR